MTSATPSSEKQLRTQYLHLVEKANAAIVKGDSAARIAAERDIADIGAKLDAIRGKRK